MRFYKDFVVFEDIRGYEFAHCEGFSIPYDDIRGCDIIVCKGFASLVKSLIETRDEGGDFSDMRSYNEPQQRLFGFLSKGCQKVWYVPLSRVKGTKTMGLIQFEELVQILVAEDWDRLFPDGDFEEILHRENHQGSKPS